MLEGAGIDVLTQNFHSATTLSNYTHATGGIELCVPDADAKAAIDILAECGPFDPPQIKAWAIPIIIFGVLWAVVPPPGTGVILRRDHIELVFG